MTLASPVFAEAHVEVDGARLRYMEAGTGKVLVSLSGGGGVRLARAHELLAERFRVIAFELPGASDDAATAKRNWPVELPTSLLQALASLRVERFSLWGSSLGGPLALKVASRGQDTVEALVLESPRDAEMDDALATLTVPTLVMFGTRDTLTRPDLGRLYREKIPNCQFVLVYDAAHDIGADRPEAFASLVGDFVERREAFIVSQKSSLLHP